MKKKKEERKEKPKKVKAAKEVTSLSKSEKMIFCFLFLAIIYFVGGFVALVRFFPNNPWLITELFGFGVLAVILFFAMPHIFNLIKVLFKMLFKPKEK